MSRKPRVIVFDLDYTLWPLYVDCSVTPPFRKDRYVKWKINQEFQKCAPNYAIGFSILVHNGWCLVNLTPMSHELFWHVVILSRNGEVVDRHHKSVEHYKDVPAVLEDLYSSGFQLAVASRTGEVEGANELIKLFGWEKYFAVKEIYPGCKIEHFTKIHEKTGVPFKDMLFFDDEPRNISDLRSKGVTCMLVTNGVTKKVVKEGLAKFYG